MNLIEYTLSFSTKVDEKEKKAKRKKLIRNIALGAGAAALVGGGIYLGNKYLKKSKVNRSPIPSYPKVKVESIKVTEHIPDRDEELMHMSNNFLKAHNERRKELNRTRDSLFKPLNKQSKKLRKEIRKSTKNLERLNYLLENPRNRKDYHYTILRDGAKRNAKSFVMGNDKKLHYVGASGGINDASARLIQKIGKDKFNSLKSTKTGRSELLKLMKDNNLRIYSR